VALRSAVGEPGSQSAIEIVDRRANVFSSTSPSEVLTCRIGGSDEVRVHGKYGRRGVYTGHGHRGGVGYEALVYRHVLEPVGLSTPRLYAACFDDGGGRAWLFVEHLEPAERLWDGGDAARAAAWIGRFQRLSATALAAPSAAMLKRYDAGYYTGWTRRTLELARTSRTARPWLKRLCERFEDLIAVLLEPPQVVCHGEYYPRNILVQGERIAPVDWESAAVGPGEIDLAAMTEWWPDAVVRDSERAYARARWPGGPPPAWERTLAAARLYMSLRWLGDAGVWRRGGPPPARFDLVRELGEALGLIQ
jgi:hypothetical protein